MSDQLTILAGASASEATSESAGASVRLRWFEMALLLCIAFGSYIFSSLHVLMTGRASSPYQQDFRWSLSLFHEGTALLLLGYILSRRKLRFADLGLRWSFGGLGSGLILAIGSQIAYLAGYFVVHSIHYAIFGVTASGASAQALFGHPGILAIPFFLLNPFFEELIVRAYLMSEIRELTGSATLAVALSVMVQTAYHLYYGWERALSLGFLFLLSAIYYSITRRATPVIVAHEVMDLLALIRLW